MEYIERLTTLLGEDGYIMRPNNKTEKINWLAKYRELWENLNLELPWRLRIKETTFLVNHMKEAGLISRTTSPIDVNLRDLIQKAKENS